MSYDLFSEVSYTDLNKVAPKKFIINIDAPIEEKWNFIKDYKKECLEILKYIETTYYSNMSYYSYYSYYMHINYFSFSGKYLYCDELKYIAKILELSFDRVLALQLFFEMNYTSTCAIVKIKKPLDIYSSINLESSIQKNDDVENIMFYTYDFSIMENLKKLTIHLDFVKDGKCIYSCVSFVGYIGCLIGMKHGQYSISANYRLSDGKLIDNIKKIGACLPNGFLVRKILESDNSIDKIKDILEKEIIIAPCYFCICSSKDKIYSIIRDIDKCKEIIEPKKYIIQTNRDNDDNKTNLSYALERQHVAEDILCKIKKFNDIDYLDVYPILNQDTVYRTILIPNIGRMCINLIDF
jgi:hypothetical protein